MSKHPYYQGISSQEITATANDLLIPEADRPRILRGITQHMVPAAKKHLNRERR